MTCALRRNHLVLALVGQLWAATAASSQTNTVPLTLDDAVTFALERNLDIAVQRRNPELQDIQVLSARSAYTPTITSALSLIRSDSGVLGSTVTETVPGGLGDAFGSLFAVENPRWSFGVNITVPIGTTAQDAALARGRVQLSQIEARLAQVELQIVTEVTSAAIQRGLAIRRSESRRVWLRFPSGGIRQLVSCAGGVQPRRSADGRELYYLTLDGTIMSVRSDSTTGSPDQRGNAAL